MLQLQIEQIGQLFGWPKHKRSKEEGMDFTDFTFTTVIVLVALVLATSATVVALVAFIRGAKAASEDLADPLRLSSVSGALSEADYALGAAQDDCVSVNGHCFHKGDPVVLATNRGGKERFGIVNKVFTNSDLLVNIDDPAGRFTTRRPASAFRRLNK